MASWESGSSDTSLSLWRDANYEAYSSTSASTAIAVPHQPLPSNDVQHSKIHLLIQMDIIFTARLSACSSGQPRYVWTSSLEQRITHDILHRQQWDWQHLKHSLRDLKETMHYKFIISPRSPQGHSLPLRQLVPPHINTFRDSDRATSIESRKCTSGTVTLYFRYLWRATPGRKAQSLHRSWRPSSMPSVEKSR